ncbi:hypothetical protein GCM10010503_37080 [Streptomyces lucensis JCM 4490]|uniref:Phosphoglycerate mutase n=1 Tax=Streptomyces lucensis JCM 4490 TaxID=1306176 RepID=A0A918J7M2_9ACTN|nr:histidine phosphatase family protein [Streptomyces lucensis]GGW56505.1 hypothetical protein GCM10010503_37080 [Streptomyces lucensis JCM 4490]
MPVIHLVRHGQASFGSPEYDGLSELGLQQAAVVGASWRGAGCAIRSSSAGTLHRQYDTAELLMKAAGLGGAPARDPRWNECDHLRLLDRHGPTTLGALADSRDPAQHLLDRALRAWMNEPDPDDDGWTDFSQGPSRPWATCSPPSAPAVAPWWSGPEEFGAPCAAGSSAHRPREPSASTGSR